MKLDLSSVFSGAKVLGCAVAIILLLSFGMLGQFSYTSTPKLADVQPTPPPVSAPIQTLPPMPTMPTLPPMPTMPTLPPMPNLPTLPPVPTMPTLPPLPIL